MTRMAMNSNRITNRVSRSPRFAFTLIEVLVVVSIIALLVAIVLPSLSAARKQARLALCGANLRQLGIANIGYAAENRDAFVLGAPDIFNGFGGQRRWHGMRRAMGVSDKPEENLFDARFSPLARYIEGAKPLAPSLLTAISPDPNRARLRECPSFMEGNFSRDGGINAYEAGAGGYGYNHLYLGGRYDLYGNTADAARASATTALVRQPALTVMFAEAAILQRVPGVGYQLFENSFIYPPYEAQPVLLVSKNRSSPAIHFRHEKRAQVAWADGHVDTRRMSFSGPYLVSGIPEKSTREFNLGWFGPRSNDWFDLK